MTTPNTATLDLPDGWPADTLARAERSGAWLKHHQVTELRRLAAVDGLDAAVGRTLDGQLACVDAISDDGSNELDSFTERQVLGWVIARRALLEVADGTWHPV